MKKSSFFLALTLTSLSLTSCYTWWEKKIEYNAQSNFEKTDLADFFYNPPKITMLDSPKQVIASQGYYSGNVKLYWQPVENATSYRIERAETPKDSTTLPEDADFSVIEEYVSTNGYTDIILSNPNATSDAYNKKYYYRICAENISKGLVSSEYTNHTSQNTAAIGWLLPPPTNVDASKGESVSEITITWKLVSKASKYIIYRGEKPNELKYIAEVLPTKTQYIDTISENDKGKEYYYKVSAVYLNSESAKSNETVGYTLANASLLPPTEFCVVDGQGTSTSEIKLSWKEISNTENATYSIYRTSNIDPSYTLINKSSIPATTTSYTDNKNLKPGVIYYYYIQTVKKNGDSTEKSAFTKKGPSAFLLSPPSTVEASDIINSEGEISQNNFYICFSDALGAVKTDDFDQSYTEKKYTYNIYKSDSLDGNFTPLTQVSPDTLEKNENGLYLLSVEKSGFYKVATVNESGVESATSITIAPLPASPKNVVASKTQGGELVNNYLPNSNNVYPVKITWDAPEGTLHSGYNIYRSTKPDSSFRKLNEQIITDTYYIDINETARAGTYYYYKVTSVNVLEQGKNSNAPENDTQNLCRGYGSITQDQWFREYNTTVMRSQSKLKLMHKPNDMDKLGTETIYGDLGGSLYYNAAIAGLGAYITMKYDNYFDFWAGGEEKNGPYIKVSGNTDTDSNMSANGKMNGIVTVTGMYPGVADYKQLEIKGGGAGGGGYLVETKDLDGNTILSQKLVDWKVGEENRK